METRTISEVRSLTFARFICAVACTVTMFLTGPVVAQDTHTTTNSSPSVTSNACNSDLSVEKFLDMIQAIANHGDLSDVAFTEKTLGEKLIEQSPTQDKNSNKHVTMYHSPFDSGRHIGVFYTIYHYVHPSSNLEKDSANISFSFVSFKYCHLPTTDMMKSRFPGKVRDSLITGSPYLAQTISLSPQFSVSYDYKDGFVHDHLFIGQTK